MVVRKQYISLDKFYDVVENDENTVHKSITVFEAQKEKEQEDWLKYLENTTFEEMEKRAASKYGRRHLGWPCDNAQDLPIGEQRSQHIKNCKECKRLFEELDRSIEKR